MRKRDGRCVIVMEHDDGPGDLMMITMGIHMFIASVVDANDSVGDDDDQGLVHEPTMISF